MGTDAQNDTSENEKYSTNDKITLRWLFFASINIWYFSELAQKYKFVLTTYLYQTLDISDPLLYQRTNCEINKLITQQSVF